MRHTPELTIAPDQSGLRLIWLAPASISGWPVPRGFVGTGATIVFIEIQRLRRIRQRLFPGNCGNYPFSQAPGQWKMVANFLTLFFTHLTKASSEGVRLIDLYGRAGTSRISPNRIYGISGRFADLE
jgi:hypothetical protein